MYHPIFPDENTLRDLIEPALQKPKRSKPRADSLARKKAYEEQHPGTVWCDSKSATLWIRKGVSGPDDTLDERILQAISANTPAGGTFRGFLGADGPSKLKGNQYIITQSAENIGALLSFCEKLGIPEERITFSISYTRYTAGKNLYGGKASNHGATEGFSFKAAVNLGFFKKTMAYLTAYDPKDIEAHMHEPGFNLGFHFGDGTQAKFWLYTKQNKSNRAIAQRIRADHAQAYAAAFGGRVYDDLDEQPTPFVQWSSHAAIADRMVNQLYAFLSPDGMEHPIKVAQYRELEALLLTWLEAPQTKAA